MITRIPAALPVTLPVAKFYTFSNKTKIYRNISNDTTDY